MVKKIVLGALFVGLIGILVAGAIIRTVDRTTNTVEARGQGSGRGHVEESGYVAELPGQGPGGGTLPAERLANGGGGLHLRGSVAEPQYPNQDLHAEDWVVHEGTVIHSPADGGELVIETESGSQVTVGTGPGYMDAQGFLLQVGERVQVEGYWEDDELKAARVTRLRDGETITLRDESGRPEWAGSGRRAAEQPTTTNSQGGLGQGNRGLGAFGGSAREEAPGGGKGIGQARVGQWLTLEGQVTHIDSSVLIIETPNAGEITMDGRAWSFAQEQGFAAQVGDQVTLVGFYDGDDFEVGQVSTSDGQTVLIREENGRPLWAGRGQRLG